MINTAKQQILAKFEDIKCVKNNCLISIKTDSETSQLYSNCYEEFVYNYSSNNSFIFEYINQYLFINIINENKVDYIDEGLFYYYKDKKQDLILFKDQYLKNGLLKKQIMKEIKQDVKSFNYEIKNTLDNFAIIDTFKIFRDYKPSSNMPLVATDNSKLEKVFGNALIQHWIRIFGIKIPGNKICITGGYIKSTKKTENTDIGQREIDKMDLLFNDLTNLFS